MAHADATYQVQVFPPPRYRIDNCPQPTLFLFPPAQAMFGPHAAEKVPYSSFRYDIMQMYQRRSI
jgi:hypothetical protein